MVPAKNFGNLSKVGFRRLLPSLRGKVFGKAKVSIVVPDVEVPPLHHSVALPQSPFGGACHWREDLVPAIWCSLHDWAAPGPRRPPPVVGGAGP